MLLQFASKPHFTQTHQTEIVPVVLYESPAVTKFIATPPPKTNPYKKVAPQPVNPRPAALTEPSTVSPEPAITASSDLSADSTVANPLTLPEETPAAATPSATALSTRPPPSASYLLDVVRTEPKVANPYYGSGEIRWSHDNKNYIMQVEVSVDVLFATIRLYSMQSEGTIEDAGIKPRSATETRRSKSTTSSYFNYDSNTISFSANPVVIPLSQGAQDKATVLMQLASIGNADPSQFQPGKQITIQVAEEKEANLHQFVVADQEMIDTRLGHLTTWHIVRPPRPRSYSSRIDIWLAPELNWLPVQIRNTETNGAITTQTIRKIIKG